MATTLFSFYEELSTLYFDKKKVQGLVKRANNAGFPIYYAYHEDGAETWKYGWSENDYKQNDDDVKLFECTNLIGKKKSTTSFKKAATYTAECAIFVFCPLSTLLDDDVLRERKIRSVKEKAAQYALSNYNSTLEMKGKVEAWDNLPQENKIKIQTLQQEIKEIFGTHGSKKIRSEKSSEIIKLGGSQPVLATWQLNVLQFNTLEDYIQHKQNEAVEKLLQPITS